jgi:hypothetical protein
MSDAQQLLPPTLRLEKAESRIAPAYANNVLITSSDRDFLIAFLQQTPQIVGVGQGITDVYANFVAQVVVSEKTMRELRDAIDRQIALFEAMQNTLVNGQGQ